MTSSLHSNILKSYWNQRPLLTEEAGLDGRTDSLFSPLAAIFSHRSFFFPFALAFGTLAPADRCRHRRCCSPFGRTTDGPSRCAEQLPPSSIFPPEVFLSILCLSTLSPLLFVSHFFPFLWFFFFLSWGHQLVAVPAPVPCHAAPVVTMTRLQYASHLDLRVFKPMIGFI